VVAVSYKSCIECGTEWPDKADFDRQNRALYLSMMSQYSYVIDIPDADDEDICPMCTHSL
jgi:hypothetical protein